MTTADILGALIVIMFVGWALTLSVIFVMQSY